MTQWIIALAAAAGIASASTGEPPAEPILRIETSMHSAFVRRLVVDAVNDRLVTAGDDKTIRVWQLPQGRLLRVLRLPIGPGYEGRIYALAITPDGKTIAAAGWTGWDWDREGAVYLFDAHSGELVRRIGGFPDVIGSLAYSKDGRHLAVGLHADAGLWVLRAPDYAIVHRDVEYHDKILGVDFHADGRLAVTALDGQLRLYDPSFRLLGRKRTAPGTQPLTVRFSPDGKLLAVSFNDAPTLAVLASSDLSLAFTPDMTTLEGFTRMSDVAWSADGHTLYGCGGQSGSRDSPIVRWRAGGRAPPEAFAAARQRIADLQPVPGGGVAFAAEDPAVGVLDADGRLVFVRGPELADFRDGDAVLQVSRDASRVQFALQRGGASPMRFSLFARELRRGAAPGADLAGAVTASTSFAVSGWPDQPLPSINGIRVELDDYELARMYAISPDDTTLVLGTEWALRAYDAGARLKWKTEVPGVVRGVVVAPNGRVAVAALGDGTVRWYRIDDGGEFLALFPHAAGDEWIAWTPDGYYLSSNFGDHYVGWHLNRGREGAADFYRAVQFERVLYRPDIVDERFRHHGRAAPGPQRRTVPRFVVSQLDAIAPPRVRIALAGAPRADSGGQIRATLRVSGERTSLPMLEQALFVNDIPVTPAGARELFDGDRVRFTREVTVNLPPGENRVRMEVSNGSSLGVAETIVDAAGPGTVSPPPGDLYVLAVGVNEFPSLKDANLSYAARDAEEFARLLVARGEGQFRRVFARSISDLGDTKPDRAGILGALDFAAGATAEDTVVLFLASHGVSDATGEYFLVPRDARAEDVAAVVHGHGADVPSLIRWNVLFESLRRTAGRRVLVVDTCHARNAAGRPDLQSLGKRSASSLVSLVLASRGNEESQEYPPARHGLFTYALLDGLRGAADANRDGVITLAEAFGFAEPLVERLRDKVIGPQTPQLLAPGPLGETVLARIPNGVAKATRADAPR